MSAFSQAWSLLKVDASDYQGHHKAPIDEDFYAPIWALNYNMFPNDVYTHPHYYESTALDEVMPILNQLRGNPYDQVAVYRSVPKGVQSELNRGDWVTPTRSYAEMHGERFDGGYDLIEEMVNAHDLLNEGNSLHEYGFLGHRNRFNEPDMEKRIRMILRELGEQ